MHIPDDKVLKFGSNGSFIIDDPYAFQAPLTVARTWGEESLGEANSGGAEELDEILAKFADSMADLRSKYEVGGELLNGESSTETAYLDELNAQLDVYRPLVFAAALDYILDKDSIELMLDIMRNY